MKKQKRIRVMLSGFIAGLFLFTASAMAVRPSYELYVQWNLQKSDLFSSALRQVGWMLIRGMHSITSKFEELFIQSFDMMGFMNAEIVSTYVEKYKVVVWALLAVGLLWLGLLLITDSLREKNKVAINLLLFAVIVAGMPFCISQLNSMVVDTTKMILNDGAGGGSATVSSQVVSSNLWDFQYIDQQDFSSDPNQGQNAYGQSGQVMQININELIEDPDAMKNKEVFNHEKFLQANGQGNVQEIHLGGILGMGKAYYYRYNYDFISILITLVASLFVFGFGSYKVIRLGWELGFARIFALVTAPLDIAVGARMKKILTCVLTMLAMLIFIAISYRMYLIGITFINGKVQNRLFRALFIFFLSLIVADGPNLIEKVLGEDVGIKSGMRTVMGTYAAARGLSAAGRAVSHGMSKTAGRAAGLGGAVAGAGTGIGHGLFNRGTDPSKAGREKNGPVGEAGRESGNTENQAEPYQPGGQPSTSAVKPENESKADEPFAAVENKESVNGAEMKNGKPEQSEPPQPKEYALAQDDAGSTQDQSYPSGDPQPYSSYEENWGIQEKETAQENQEGGQVLREPHGSTVSNAARESKYESVGFKQKLSDSPIVKSAKAGYQTGHALGKNTAVFTKNTANKAVPENVKKKFKGFNQNDSDQK